MNRVMLRAKLHRATVTDCDLNYEGSCGVDAELLHAAGMLPNEYVEIYNVNNGERFSTYLIEAARGSGAIALNGAAARKAQPGDPLIICTYAPMAEADAARWRPRVVVLGAGNRIADIKD
jgi:aspartate 1-decarboxylase